MKKTVCYRPKLFFVTAVLLAVLCALPCKVYAKEAPAKKQGMAIVIGENKKTVEPLKGTFLK